MKRVLFAAATLAAASTLLSVTPAFAGPASDSVTVGPTGSGSIMVSQFRQLYDGSGYSWVHRGTAACTVSTSNQDYGRSNLNINDWNDVVSYLQDYNQCDVKVFQDTNYEIALTGYVNYGSSGRGIADGLNNRTSSYYLS